MAMTVRMTVNHVEVHGSHSGSRWRPAAATCPAVTTGTTRATAGRPTRTKVTRPASTRAGEDNQRQTNAHTLKLGPGAEVDEVHKGSEALVGRNVESSPRSRPQGGRIGRADDSEEDEEVEGQGGSPNCDRGL